MHWRLLCLISLSWTLPAWADAPKEFRFCYENKEIYPYYTGEGVEVPASKPGASIEVLQQLDAETPEIDFRYERSPWKRCLYNLELGVVDGLIGSYQPERERIGVYPRRQGELDFSRAINTSSSYCLFLRRGASQGWDGENFTGKWPYPIAVPFGYSVADFIRDKGLDVYEAKDRKLALLLLQNGRASGAALLCEPAIHLLDRRSADYPDVVLHQPPLEIRGAYLLFSKDFYQENQVLAEQLWDRIGVLRDTLYEVLYFQYLSEQISD